MDETGDRVEIHLGADEWQVEGIRHDAACPLDRGNLCLTSASPLRSIVEVDDGAADWRRRRLPNLMTAVLRHPDR